MGNPYAKIFLRGGKKVSIYFNSVASRMILKKFVGDYVVFDYENGKLYLLPSRLKLRSVKAYKIQKKYNSIEVTLPSELRDEVVGLGLVGKPLPVIIDKNMIEVFLHPELINIHNGVLESHFDNSPMFITLIGSRFWKDWQTRNFRLLVSQFRKSWENADYDLFSVIAIPSIKYVMPCLKGNVVNFNCVNESIEKKLSSNIEIKAVSFRVLAQQVLKSNANFIYYLTSDMVHIDSNFKPLLKDFLKYSAKVLDEKKFLLSLYGVSVGSFRSSEGQALNRKSNSRFINSLRFSILTIYFYYNLDKIKSVNFSSIRNNFDKIYSEVYEIVNPKYPIDFIHYVVDLKEKIMKVEGCVNESDVKEFISIVRQIQEKIDEVYQ